MLVLVELVNVAGLSKRAVNMVDYTTCQASGAGLVHGDSLDDAILHFSGCLKLSERADFLAELDETNKIKLQIREKTGRVARLRSILDAEGPRTPSGKILDNFKKTFSHWSGEKRSYSHLEVATEASDATPTLEAPEEREKEWILNDLTANVIYFKKASEEQHPEPFDHPAFSAANFPNQKVPLQSLLSPDKDSNPLMWDCEPDMIRYFHLPANNMEWVEVRIIYSEIVVHALRRTKNLGLNIAACKCSSPHRTLNFVRLCCPSRC